MRMLSLDGQKTIQTVQTREDVQGTDYDFQTNTIFWFSYYDKKIYTAAINMNAELAKKSVFHDSSSRIDGVAVDWIHEHLYWADWGREEICVSNFNGTMKKVLFTGGIRYPLAIVLNPLNGWMYWSDRRTYRIERAGLDGSRREVTHIANSVRPYGLVVDFVDSRLYWSQGEDPSSIWSSEFDGSDPKLIFENQHGFSSSLFYKVATFDKYVYFIEHRSDTIYRVNKCNGNELEMIYKSESDLRDVKIYDATLQPTGENLCLKQIGRCSHLCFPVPVLSSGNGVVSTTKCACPDGLSLSTDQHNCV